MSARKLLGLWDRGDGYDDRDPDAPHVERCGGCDAYMFDGTCGACEATLEEMSVAEKVARFTPVAFEHPSSTFDGEIIPPSTAAEIRQLGQRKTLHCNFGKAA